MAKLTLADLSSLTNETTAVSTINNNHALIEAALENTLSRDGSIPNAMAADLDMNGNNILNLPKAASDTEPVRRKEFDAYVAGQTTGDGTTTVSSDFFDVDDIKALKSGDFAEGETIRLRYPTGAYTHDFSEFTVLSGSALSNGYSTVDGVLVVQNNDGDTTFVRTKFLAENLVDFRWWEPPLDGTSSISTAWAAMTTTLSLYATETRQITVDLWDGGTFGSPVTVPNYVTYDGHNRGELRIGSGVSLSASVITALNGPTLGASEYQRNAYNIHFKNIVFNGVGRVYPAWLSNSSGTAITDPAADYWGSTGYLNPTLYSTSFTSLTALAAQTLFAATWDLLTSADTYVFRDRAGTRTRLLVTTDYTIDLTANTITLAAGATAGDIIVISTLPLPANLVTANRRNATGLVFGYFINLSGPVDCSVTGCTFRDIPTTAVAFAGPLRGRITNNIFDNIGRISFSSNAVLVTDFSSAWPVTAVSKANPCVVTTATATGLAVDATIRLRDINWGTNLPAQRYKVSAISGLDVTIKDYTTGVNIDSSGFASTFVYDGLGLLTADFFIEAQDTIVEENTFFDLKRAPFQIGGKDITVRNCIAKGCRESGIYLARTIGGVFEEITIEDLIVADIVANGAEINYSTGSILRNNNIIRCDLNGFAAVGFHKMQLVGNYTYRTGHRGNSNRPYGPFGERYGYSAPPAIAGLPLTDIERIPMRLQSLAGVPISGSILGNVFDDNRVTPMSTTNAGILFQSAGSASFFCRNLDIADNNFSNFPTGNVEQLIDYGTSATIVDAQTTTVRNNKKHSSQSTFVTKLVSYSSGTTGDQLIEFGFPPSAVEVWAVQATAAFPVRQSFGMLSKTHATQTASAASALSIAFTGAAANVSSNLSTFATLKDSAGVAAWTATFVSWEPTGLKINIGTSTIGANLYIRAFP